jgi:hypothetical protein
VRAAAALLWLGTCRECRQSVRSTVRPSLERAALSHRVATGHRVEIREAGAVDGGGDAVLELLDNEGEGGDESAGGPVN